MDNLKTVEGKVKAVLQKNEDARNDDMVLYLALCIFYIKKCRHDAACGNNDTA